MDAQAIISAAAVIFAAMIGGFGAKLFADWRQAQSLRAALSAELRAILDVEERRGYVDTLNQFVSQLPPDWHGDMASLATFTARVRNQYQAVFYAVVNQIGLLPADLAAEVVTVHYYVQLFLEDLSLSSTARTDATSAWILQDYQTYRHFYEDFAEIATETRTRVRELINRLEGV